MTSIPGPHQRCIHRGASHPPRADCTYSSNWHCRPSGRRHAKHLRSRHAGHPANTRLLWRSALQHQGSSSAACRAASRSEGASADFGVIFSRLKKLTLPYWLDPEAGGRARWRLATVVALTIGTTGVSVAFSFLGRDFYNALSEKDVERFYKQIVKWLVALSLGIPVFVLRDYYLSLLQLEWREWMTTRLTRDYLSNQAFYRMQTDVLIDNPDQRISSDIRQFTESALSLSQTLLNAAIDLVSFSGILYTIYPPLFVVLVVYSVGGTAISLRLGRPLVSLNFQQEAQEANLRYGLVRVRENAESIAFYGGEAQEQQLLMRRLQRVVENNGSLIVTTRNLEFFTSFYRFLIQILPAATVAPLFFQGKIEFGVINQSSSAFNHILTDVSLVVYQLESIAGFSAVIDRLGQFTEVTDVLDPAPSASLPEPEHAEGSEGAASVPSSSSNGAAAPGIVLQDLGNGDAGRTLLRLQDLKLQTPDNTTALVDQLSLEVTQGRSLLITGASGAGKTSILRAVAGLWSSGSGSIRRLSATAQGGTMFLPQRPYMVLGTLRDQLLYPTWSGSPSAVPEPSGSLPATSSRGGNVVSMPDRTSAGAGPRPDDSSLEQVLRDVRLGHLLDRQQQGSHARSASAVLDAEADWASVLSLGEQQRLAFARVVLSKPRLVLMDESTSALDVDNESRLYSLLRERGVTFVSVGHRPTLADFHDQVLRLKPGPERGPATYDLVDSRDVSNMLDIST